MFPFKILLTLSTLNVLFSVSRWKLSTEKGIKVLEKRFKFCVSFFRCLRSFLLCPMELSTNLRTLKGWIPHKTLFFVKLLYQFGRLNHILKRKVYVSNLTKITHTTLHSLTLTTTKRKDEVS